ncbi:MAG TPA: chorismate mutase [Candidatus Dormibacteraeota bacterium]|nr:chorismate mutase [Candidatus Dormibacteraeota bacterium]
MRGIRGATTVESDSAKEIEESTTELLRQLIDANHIDPSDIAGAWFTTTRDLAAEFPAVAARKLGWTEVPLLCGHEMSVVESNPRSIDHCIRVMILLNTDRPAADMNFIYLRRAAEIKADLDRLKAGRGDE